MEKRIDSSKSNGFRLGLLALIVVPICVYTFQYITETPVERASRESHRARLAAAREQQSAADAAAKAKKEAERQQKSDEAEAVAMAKEFVKRRLKAPATAEFASTRNHTVHSGAENEFVVTGYVDAQNSFGAQIRTRYICRLKRIDDAGNWRLIELVM